jgi:hypothetical protein
VLRRIFGSKRNEVTDEWRKLHNEKLNDLYCSTNTVQVIKSRKILMGGEFSTYRGRGEVYTGFWCGNLRERDHLGDSSANGKIILRWIFRKWDIGAWTGTIWLRIGTGDGHL